MDKIKKPAVQQLKTLCACCGKTIIPGDNKQEPSHGICHKCSSLELAKFNNNNKNKINISKKVKKNGINDGL